MTLPAQVFDTATVTPGVGATAGGTVKYALYTDNACTVASIDPVFDPASSATVTIAADGTIPPSPTLTFSTVGTYYWQATYTPPAGSRDSGSTSVCTSEPLIVVRPQPAIATNPSGPSRSAVTPPRRSTMSPPSAAGSSRPEASPSAPSRSRYGPFAAGTTITDSSCTAANLLATSANAASRVTNTTATAISDSFTPTVAGRYQWTAAYSGNAQNLAVPATACGDATEQVVVTPQTPTLATRMLLSDRAVVSGVPNAGTPTGTVVFGLFPSTDCTGTAVYTSGSITISASGGAATPVATEVNAGSYSWKVTFTPDAGNPNYTAASTTCTAAQSDQQATFSYAGTSPAN